MSKLLRVMNVKKHFGGVHALTGCDIEIEKRKITALIGPNGCGKSTLFNTINKLIKQNSGRIIFLEKDITKTNTHKVAKLGISRTFQHPTLFINLTISDHLEIALGNDESLLKSLFGKQKNHLPKIKEIIDLVGLNKPLKTLGSDLSYGQRKLLDLAVAIAQPHQLIMLDEPVAGINPQLRNKIKTILKKLKEQGETLLVIEHDMNFIMDIADEVYVMDEGKILVKGEPKKIQKNKKVLEAYLGG